MATYDERRAVARRLRGMAPGSDWPRMVAEACGMDTAKMSGNFHEYTEQLCIRLADLIEPDERRIARGACVMEGGPHRDERTCSACGTRFCIDSYQASTEDGGCYRKFRYCPECGAKVVEG